MPKGKLSSARSQSWFAFCAYTALILAPTYNAILALVNAHFIRTPKAAAILAELFIFALSVLACILRGSRNADRAPLILMLLFIIISLFMSLTNDTLYPDPARNIAIICCFTALGFRLSEAELNSIFKICSAIVGIFLLVEIFSLETYVWIFRPADYLEASRGIAQFELNDTGLFANAIGFQDRFSFGVFSGPRTSSIFLEQVSLPSFASVALIFLVSKWCSLTKAERFGHVALIILIVLSNNSRTSGAMLVFMALGYWVYPLISSRFSFILPVFCLSMAFLLTGPLEDARGGDDLIGRLTVTVLSLNRFDIYSYLFGSLSVAYHSFDSGYAYIIASCSIWGMIALFSYITFAPGYESASQRRAHWSMALYVYVWLLIGGTAIFTMKTAGLLWVVIGHMVYHRDGKHKNISKSDQSHLARVD